jgi:hypothetical protein
MSGNEDYDPDLETDSATPTDAPPLLSLFDAGCLAQVSFADPQWNP